MSKNVSIPKEKFDVLIDWLEHCVVDPTPMALGNKKFINTEYDMINFLKGGNEHKDNYQVTKATKVRRKIIKLLNELTYLDPEDV